MSDEDEEPIVYEDIESAEEYAQWAETVSDLSTSRYAQYHTGKLRAAEETLLAEEDVDVEEYAEDLRGSAQPNTVEAARNKGRIDAISDFEELGLLEDDEPVPDVNVENPGVISQVDEGGEQESGSRSIPRGGTEIDADEF